MEQRKHSKYMIDILMSTYNGTTFLHQQINSILNQTYTNWRLIIRDDGSSDATKTIIESYVLSHPDKIIIVDKNTPNLGSTKSFERLKKPFGNEPYRNIVW